MREMGSAMMGTGEASGDQRALRAAEAAISNPLIYDASMRGARGLLISITGGRDLTLFEVDQAKEWRQRLKNALVTSFEQRRSSGPRGRRRGFARSQSMPVLDPNLITPRQHERRVSHEPRRLRLVVGTGALLVALGFPETRNYVQRVMENLQVYRVRFGETKTATSEPNPGAN
jgi:hypothetical protein